MNRYLLLFKRFIRARAFGVTFTGTTGFQLPKTIRLGKRRVNLSLPDEVGPGLDFINLALDDEYGLRQLCSPIVTVLDVGANFGLFSLLAAQYFPSATVHAYEPSPKVFQYAKINLQQTGGLVFQEGVGCESMLAEMHEKGDSRLARTMPSESGDIRITPLRQAIERMGGEVDLLKLDCEGAEWDIFNDVDAFRNVGLIRMEYHLFDGHVLEDLKSCAKKIGFRIDHLDPNTDFGIAWMSRAGN